MSAYTFFAPGLPKGQPRPRAFARNGRAAVYDPGTAEGWKSSVAIAAKQGDHSGRLLESNLYVSLRFVMPRPKSHFTSKGELKASAPPNACGKKPDVDNLAKAVLDALTTIQVWKDDCQVCVLRASKHYAAPGSPSGCHILISTISN